MARNVLPPYKLNTIKSNIKSKFKPFVIERIKFICHPLLLKAIKRFKKIEKKSFLAQFLVKIQSLTNTIFTYYNVYREQISLKTFNYQLLQKFLLHVSKHKAGFFLPSLV